MILVVNFSLTINNKLSRQTSIILGITLSLVLIVSSISVSFASFSGSPNFQLESDVVIEDILCRDDRVLVLRSSDSIACVT